jgi:hypothetical protein
VSSLADNLLPGNPDESLARFSEVVVTDHGVAMPVTALDQLLASLTRQFVSSRKEQTIVVLLPRGKHDTALLLGISSQLLCRRAPCHLDGPVTVIASDVDLIGRLRALGVAGRRRIGLHEGNPLNAHRVRGDGTLQPAYGHEVGDVNRSFLYLNSRVRWPELHWAERGLAVIDGTSITSPDSRMAAVKWAQKYAWTIIVIGDLGDEQLVASIREQSSDPVVLSFTWSDLSQLAYEMGTTPPVDSALSSAILLHRAPPTIRFEVVKNDIIDQALLDGFTALARTPPGPLPYQVSKPATLIRVGSRLAAHDSDYRVAATQDPSNLVMSPWVMLRSLDRRFDPPSGWRSWGTAQWGALVTASRALWTEIERSQPKLQQLWMLLERLGREDSNSRIVIRNPNRAAATALRVSLTHERRTDAQVETWDSVSDRVEFARFSDRFSWSEDRIEILTGAPPPRSLPLLVGGEAREIYLMVYRPEAVALQRLSQRWTTQLEAWRVEAEGRLGFESAHVTENPVPEQLVSTVVPRTDATRFNLPDLSLETMIEKAFSEMDERDVTGTSGQVISIGERRSLIPY